MDINHISLMDLLPVNLKEDSEVVNAAKALDDEINSVTKATGELILFANLDNLPEKVIDLLAWQLHVDFWDNDFDIKIKREMVKNSISWHKRKGTPSVVEEVVSEFLDNAIVREWFMYGGDPYTFRIETSGLNDSKNTMNQLVTAVNSVKNARSHLVGVTINMSQDVDSAMMKLMAGTLQCRIGRKRINLPSVTNMNVMMSTGVAYARSGKYKIGFMIPLNLTGSIYSGNIIRRVGKITIGGMK